MKTITLSRAAGFTLLEVLVAVAVFAVLSTLSYAGLSRMVEGRDRIEAEREKWRALTLAFAQLEDDLGQARPRGVRDASGTGLPMFRGQPVDPRPQGEPILEFTRGGFFVANKGVSSDLRRVGYRFREGVLMRLAWPTLDRPPIGEPWEFHLLSNVDNLTLRFHAANGGWHERWPANETQNTLPDAVEFSFDVTGIGRVTRILMVAR